MSRRPGALRFTPHGARAPPGPYARGSQPRVSGTALRGLSGRLFVSQDPLVHGLLAADRIARSPRACRPGGRQDRASAGTLLQRQLPGGETIPAEIGCVALFLRLIAGRMPLLRPRETALTARLCVRATGTLALPALLCHFCFLPRVHPWTRRRGVLGSRFQLRVGCDGTPRLRSGRSPSLYTTLGGKSNRAPPAQGGYREVPCGPVSTERCSQHCYVAQLTVELTFCQD